MMINYLIVFIFTSQMPLNVCGMPKDSKEVMTISNDQLQYLVESFCDLEIIPRMKMESCQKSFFKSQFQQNGNTPERLPPAKIRCHNDGKIKFQVTPSSNWQLVVLVPQKINNTDYDKYSVNFCLVPPKVEYEEVVTPEGTNTLWSTELTFEGPLQWRGGYIVPHYDPATRQSKKYDINVEFFAQKSGMMTALFTWDVTSDVDKCFDVVNSCHQSGITEEKVWPDSKSQKFFHNLSLHDNCEVLVTGFYGTTILRYITPELCDNNTNCTVSKRVPDYPENVSLEATQSSAATWDIHVSWAQPRFPIERLNITLHVGNGSNSILLAGDKTSVVFEGVSGTGLYTVELHAKLGRKTAVTSRAAIFPVMGDGSGGAGAGRGLTLGAGACVALVLSLALAWRRARAARRTSNPPPIEELPKKGDIEDIIGIVPESEDSWEIRSDRLLLHEVIGEGAFGVVRRAALAPNGKNVAVKMLKEFPSVDEMRSFWCEMELMKNVGTHPNVVSLVGVCSTFARRPMLVAEFCSRGDLLTYLRCTWDVMVSKSNAKYYNNNIETSDYRNDLFKCKTENSNIVVNKLYDIQETCDIELTTLDLLSFCRQIAMGMEFLAANRVVHRDLAARNILVTADRTLKIADFGLSRDVYEENQYKQKGNGMMPVKWMAPESLTRKIYTSQSDVWSFGVVVWEVATMGASPYPSVTSAKLPRLLRTGYRMPQPSNCSQEMYDIMVSCWRAVPRERPTFAELHSLLDELVLGASANDYLALELEPPLDGDSVARDLPHATKYPQYFKMFFSKSKRNCSRSEIYERPLKQTQNNHYSSPPKVLARVPVI